MTDSLRSKIITMVDMQIMGLRETICDNMAGPISEMGVSDCSEAESDIKTLRNYIEFRAAIVKNSFTYNKAIMAEVIQMILDMES